MPKQIILTLSDDGVNVDGRFDEGLTEQDIAWMLKCAEVELITMMAENHTSISVSFSLKEPKE